MKRLLPASAVIAIVLAQSAVEADNAFYRVLAAKPNATFGDAVRAFLELNLETDVTKTPFEKQAAVLTDMTIIRPGWTQDPEAKLTRGRTAYMICRTCSIKGGLTMAILGPTERYAFRECVFIGVWEGGTQRDYMTGGELVGVLKWTADYLDLHPGKKARLSSSAQSIRKETISGGAVPFGPSPGGKKEESRPPAKTPETRTPASSKPEVKKN
jgi:hypothetical protein